MMGCEVDLVVPLYLHNIYQKMYIYIERDRARRGSSTVDK
jgi:hypothetical protein